MSSISGFYSRYPSYLADFEHDLKEAKKAYEKHVKENNEKPEVEKVGHRRCLTQLSNFTERHGFFQLFSCV